jgi:beta-alanine degradation protein BauB
MTRDRVSASVGTAVLFENERIRVWELVLEPGQASPVHRHDLDYVFVGTTPGRIEFEADGQPPATTDYEAGFVQYTAVGSGVTHRIRNTGRQVYREILVEFKGPSVAASAQPPEDNGRSRPVPDN